MTAALQVLQPSSVVDCAHYRCKLSARACVLRQDATIKSRYGVELKAPSINSFCVTGDCEQGRGVAIALTGQSLVPVRKPSGWRPQLKLVSPAPRPLERRRIAPLSTLPPAALEDIGEDLDEACAPPRAAPLPQHQIEERRAEIAAAVLARREEEVAVRPPPPSALPKSVSRGARRRRRARDPLQELCRAIGSYVSARVVCAMQEVLTP